ncbi:type IV secretion system protein [Escherichia coli]|uniref:type IV secretion system protein n=1 Tax=Escherichia coli TaxID=562 RepID=UPI00130ABCE4|nr:type IV secretion system protein [Salmonella enterica]EBP3183683.1 type IV secretion system protein [Salmonella enterica]EGL6966935.1 type IV secretion system protein [Salmonella enterica]ELN7376130.1 type IV secretion system protein [Salmonella enterica]ELO5683098.1 type IV secretion system protein [Salmonella enterica]
MNIVSEFVTTVTNIVQSGAASNAAKLANAISPVFFAAIGVYIIFIAYEIIYAQKDVIMSEVTKTVMAFTVVGAFTYSAPYYSQYVIPFVMHSGQDLSTAVSGSSDVATSVDASWNKLSDTMEAFWAEATGQLGMTDFGLWIKAALIYGVGYAGGFALIFYTTVFLCVSIFMVGLVLSVGILFICFSVFPSTRSMFTAWCGSCLNYILLNVFYTVSFGFVMSLIEKYTQVDAATLTFMNVIMLLAVVLISVYLIEQIGTLCSTLTGGVGINGLTAAANGMTGKLAAATGLRSFGNAGRGLVGSVAKKLASKTLGATGRLGKNILGG